MSLSSLWKSCLLEVKDTAVAAIVNLFAELYQKRISSFTKAWVN